MRLLRKTHEAIHQELGKHKFKASITATVNFKRGVIEHTLKLDPDATKKLSENETKRDKLMQKIQKIIEQNEKTTVQPNQKVKKGEYVFAHALHY